MLCPGCFKENKTALKQPGQMFFFLLPLKIQFYDH